MTEDAHLPLGGYVLGGLSERDRVAFEEHALQCTRCRADLAEAAPLPDLLNAVPSLLSASHPVGLERGSPSKHFTPTPTPTRLAPRPSGRRLVTLGAAACLASAAIGVAATLVTDRGTSHHPTASSSPVQGDSTGFVSMSTKPWGTALKLDVEYLPKHSHFTLKAIAADGHSESAASWASTANGHAIVEGATSIRPAQLRRLVVIGAHGAQIAHANV